ncbi:MAG: pilus assembly protein TadG-related protein [Henriciella sp.]
MDKPRNLLRDRRGNVAMIFALAIIPIIGVAGFAMDTQLAFSQKGKIQHAVDSATLAGARMLQTTKSVSKVRKHTRAYFDAITADAGNNLVCDTLDVKIVGEEEIETSTRCYQPTTLTRIFGRETIEFGVLSTATYGIGKLDVAFVFDISGSMRGGPLDDLQNAAQAAADTLLPEPGASGEGDVRIAMVSYNSMIDAGEYFEEVTGLKKNRTYSAVNNYREEEEYEEEYTTWEQDCQWECKRYSGRSGRCRDWDYVCGDWEEVTRTRTNSRWVDKTEIVTKSMSSTCVWERDGDSKFTDDQPEQYMTGDLVNTLQERTVNGGDSGSNTEGFMAAGYAYWDDYYDRWHTTGTECLDVQPFELNDNATQIEKYIDDLYANRGTAGHQGIAWGWYLISPKWKAVFDGTAEPLAYDEPDSTKAMIVMTDGEFNSQFYSSQGGSTAQAKAVCDEIKDAGVIIYTVAFDAPAEGVAVLDYCASGEEFAFRASNGQELLDSYQAIAAAISDLRIKS